MSEILGHDGLIRSMCLGSLVDGSDTPEKGGGNGLILILQISDVNWRELHLRCMDKRVRGEVTTVSELNVNTLPVRS